MSTSIGNLALQVSANITPLTSALAKAGSGIGGFARGIAGTFNGVAGGITGGLSQIGLAINGVREIFNVLDTVVGTPLKAFAEFEDGLVTMTAMLQDAGRAKKLTEELFDFATRSPLQATELLDASKKLIGFGTDASKVLPTLKVLGDVSAGSGKDLNELAVIFGQIRSAGRLMGQDLLQLTSSNIPIISELNKKFGTTGMQLRKMVEDGKVSFNDVAAAMVSMTSKGGIFYDMQATKSRTLSGQWSNLRDEWGRLMITLGDTIAGGTGLKGLLSDAIVVGGAFRELVTTHAGPVFQRISEGAKMVGGYFLDLVDTFKIVGSAAYRHIGLPIQKVVLDAMEHTAKLLEFASRLPGGGGLSGTAAGAARNAAAWRAMMVAEVGLAEQWKTTKIGDSRQAFADGVQTMQAWLDGVKAAAAAKRPGFWGQLFEDALRLNIGDSLAGLGTSITGKLSAASGAAVRGSQEAEAIVARSQGGGINELKKINQQQLDQAKRLVKLTEEANRLARTAGDIIVDF